METSTHRIPRSSGAIRVATVALALATVFAGIGTTTAQAAERDRGHDRGHHERYRGRGHGYDHGYVYASPDAYYAPPPVEVYSPPPPSPGINFVFPLHIR